MASIPRGNVEEPLKTPVAVKNLQRFGLYGQAGKGRRSI